MSTYQRTERDFTQRDVDAIAALRQHGYTWHEVVRATEISLHHCKRLHRDGIRPNRKPRAYAAGERDSLTVEGVTRTLREWTIDWLRGHRAEHEITDDAILAAVKVLRRRIADGWEPIKVVTAAPKGRKAQQKAWAVRRARPPQPSTLVDEYEQTLAKWPKAHPAAPDTAKHLDLQRTAARVI